MTEEHIFANALNQSNQIDSVCLNKIKKTFGSFRSAWDASTPTFIQATEKKGLREFRKEINPEKEFELLKKEKITILLKEELPSLLKEIDTSPEILYLKGTLPEQNKIHLSVVGPRKFSSYGKEVCQKLISGMKDYNMVIVSGLAAGIDSIAHKTALNNKIRTVAVLGNGLHPNVLFPAQNLKLMEEIIENDGAILSEYPLCMKAALFTFPQRNRIVAGMTSGTLVAEAPKKSGAMITAFLALEYNREVFAVPGSIFAVNSEGTNNLIKLGALPVTKTDDILRALGIEPKNELKQENLSGEEKTIISFLYEPMERDELLRKSGMQSKQINPLLSEMEIKGIIKDIDGKLHKI